MPPTCELGPDGSRFRWGGRRCPARARRAASTSSTPWPPPRRARALGVPDAAIVAGLARPRTGARAASSRSTPVSRSPSSSTTPTPPTGSSRSSARPASWPWARLLVVFGCRRRPRPGQAAAHGRGGHADCPTSPSLTSDNPAERGPRPRSSPRSGPGAAGPARLVVEPDRAGRHRAGPRPRRPGDVVVIAGKGHETGQEIGGRVVPFDDAEVARRGLSGRSASASVPGASRDRLLDRRAASPCSSPLVGTPLLIRWLRSHGIGQQIREDGPAGPSHQGGHADHGRPGHHGRRRSCGYLGRPHQDGLHRAGPARHARHRRGGRWSASPTTGSRSAASAASGSTSGPRSAGQLVVALGFALGCVYWLKVDTHLSFTRYNSLQHRPRPGGLGRLGRARSWWARPTP